MALCAHRQGPTDPCTRLHWRRTMADHKGDGNLAAFAARCAWGRLVLHQQRLPPFACCPRNYVPPPALTAGSDSPPALQTLGERFGIWRQRPVLVRRVVQLARAAGASVFFLHTGELIFAFALPAAAASRSCLPTRCAAQCRGRQRRLQGMHPHAVCAGCPRAGAPALTSLSRPRSPRLQLLMGSRGYGFHFATTLSALHFLVCGVAVLLSQARNKQQEKGSKGGGKLPIKGGQARRMADWLV